MNSNATLKQSIVSVKKKELISSFVTKEKIEMV